MPWLEAHVWATGILLRFRWAGARFERMQATHGVAVLAVLAVLAASGPSCWVSAAGSGGGVNGVKEAVMDKEAWENTSELPPAKFLVQRQQNVNGGDVFVFSNDPDLRRRFNLDPLPEFPADDQDTASTCPYSAVICHRERIHPLHHVSVTGKEKERVRVCVCVCVRVRVLTALSEPLTLASPTGN